MARESWQRYQTGSCLCLAAVSIFAISFTPIHLVLTGYSYPDYFNENIGFRFFWTMRWMDGAPDDFIHPGQGVLLPFIQAIYYHFTFGDLWHRMNQFAHLTVVGGVVFMAIVLLLIAMDPRLHFRAKAALLIAPVVLALSHLSSFSYHIYPDYHAYEKPLLLLTVWTYVRLFICAKPTVKSFIWLGVLAGLNAALKINLGPLVLLLAISAGPLRGFFFAAAASFIVYASLLAAYYGFHIAWIARYFNILFIFSENAPQFAWGQLSPFGLWNTYASMSNLGFYLILGAVLIAVVAFARPRIAAVLFAILAFSFWMAVKRGGGASYFDALVVTVYICAIAVAAIERHVFVTTGTLSIMILNVVIWSASNMNMVMLAGSSGKGVEIGWQRHLFLWNRSHGLPIYGIFPSNHLLGGTIEDMIMRGFSNFLQSWYQSNDNPSRKKLFPNYTFGSYDLKIKRPAVVEWTEAKHPFPFDDDIDAHNMRMKQITANFGKECIAAAPLAAPYLVVHSCVVR